MMRPHVRSSDYWSSFHGYKTITTHQAGDKAYVPRHHTLPRHYVYLSPVISYSIMCLTHSNYLRKWELLILLFYFSRKHIFTKSVMKKPSRKVRLSKISKKIEETYHQPLFSQHCRRSKSPSLLEHRVLFVLWNLHHQRKTAVSCRS